MNKKMADAAELRLRAEDRLKQSLVAAHDNESDAQKLLQELQIRNIELEMQNKELRHAETIAHAALQRYTDLYDSAPVGYFTLDYDGLIHMTNPAGAAMLAPGRSMPIGQRIGSFVSAESLPALEAFLHETFLIHETGSRKVECELALTDNSGASRHVHIEGYSAERGGECRTIMTDITARREIENALLESEFFFRESQRAASIGSYKADFITGFWESSETLDHIFGIGKGYSKSIQGWLDLVHQDDAKMMDRYLREEVISKREPFNKEYRIIRKSDGETRWVLGLGKITFDAEGNAISMLGTIQDITGHKLAEKKINLTNRALNVISMCNRVMQRAREENALLHEMCRIIVENGGYRFAWVGYAEHDQAKAVRPMAHAGYEAGYLEIVNITWIDTQRGRGPTGTAIRSGQPSIMRDIHTDPAFAPWRADAMKRGYSSAIAIPLRVEEQIIGALNIYSAEPDAFDPDEVDLLTQLADDLVFGIASLRQRAIQKNTEEQIQRLAHYDSLTELPNRALFFDRLQQALATAKRDKARLAVMFLDIDLFKPVNDTLGHDIGDLLLKEIAQRIQGCLRESDTAARMGGDEFVVLLPTIEMDQDALVVAEKICAALNQPFEIAGHAIRISSSIGIAAYPENGSEEKALLKNADTAMYYAKESGRNTVRFFPAAKEEG